MLMTSIGIKTVGSVTAIVLTVAIYGVCGRLARTETEKPSRQTNFLATSGRSFLDEKLTDAVARPANTHGWQEVLLPHTGNAQDAFDRLGVKDTVVSVADWQLREPVRFDPGDWTFAPLYDGLMDTSLVTGDPKYLAAVIRAGRQVALQPVPCVYVVND